jgi:hypothetical protein
MAAVGGAWSSPVSRRRKGVGERVREHHREVGTRFWGGGMSYLIFMPKSNSHRMCPHEHLFHTYRQKGITKMSNVMNKI